MVYEHRYNEIIDRMIAEERRESKALQRIIFPTVALYLSTLLVAVFKPQEFVKLGIPGVAEVYRDTVAGVVGEWYRACRRRGINYHRITTDTPFGIALRRALVQPAGIA
jgi:hypothetical protein